MATTVTRYVNTNSTAGGNGTTSATSGANRAYASLSEWEAARQRNLVTADEIELVECMGTNADTTACDINGWTTDATRYIVIQCTGANRHTGVWDTSKYRLDVASGGWALINRMGYTRIYGLQMAYSGATAPCLYLYGQSVTMTGYYAYNILRCTNTGSGGTIFHAQRSDGAGSLYIYNNLLIDSGQHTGVSVSNGATFLGTVYVENNTIVRPTPNTTGSGINSSNLTYARNNIIYGYGNTNTYTYTVSNLVGDNNSTDSTDTMAGTPYNNKISQTFSFVNSAGLDFDLKPSDTGAIGRGMQISSLSSGLTDDIIGRARPSNRGFVSVGCFERPVGDNILVKRRRTII